MTIALCLNCGETKWGALCPCTSCQVESTGDMGIDIGFSDHYYTVTTLEQFGSVIKEINSHCDDQTKCYRTFIYYISQNHPNILRVEMKAEMEVEVEAIIAKCTLPSVVIEDSHELLQEREIESDKPWWKFW